MIEIQAKKHDQYSLEFKIGLIGRKRLDISNFVINTWIFIPYSLDINSLTYNKEMFYRDIKSYLRLITPVYLLRDLARPDSEPLLLLEKSFRELATQHTRTAAADYESQIKMFASILKSSLRDELYHIRHNTIEEDHRYLCREYLKNVREIALSYRRLRRVINVSTVPAELLDYYRFGDEFISNAIEQNTYQLLFYLEKKDSGTHPELKAEVEKLLTEEIAYKKEQAYLTVSGDSREENRNFVYRAGVLKKYIEGDLFLSVHKKSNTFMVEQVVSSMAAGLAMIFATAVAFHFQREYGNLAPTLFAALVISYILKDRIKDLMRYFFAHRLVRRFFDHKTKISRKNEPIGWSKEGFDYITDDKVPREVMEIRNRTALVKAENRTVEEKIILYRKRVLFKRKQLLKNNPYAIPGINDIIRFNISEFFRQTDNPEVPLFNTNSRGEHQVVKGEKGYYLNFIMQCRYEEQQEYKRYRIFFNRNGILKLESF